MSSRRETCTDPRLVHISQESLSSPYPIAAKKQPHAAAYHSTHPRKPSLTRLPRGDRDELESNSPSLVHVVHENRTKREQNNHRPTENTDRSQSNDSDDENTTIAKRNSRFTTGIERGQIGNAERLGLLQSYHDVFGEAFNDRPIYLDFVANPGCFLVTLSDKTVYWVSIQDITKYSFARSDRRNALSCLVEGPSVEVPHHGRKEAFWAIFKFRSNEGQVLLQNKLNLVGCNKTVVDRTEKWIGDFLKRKWKPSGSAAKSRSTEMDASDTKEIQASDTSAARQQARDTNGKKQTPVQLVLPDLKAEGRESHRAPVQRRRLTDSLRVCDEAEYDITSRSGVATARQSTRVTRPPAIYQPEPQDAANSARHARISGRSNLGYPERRRDRTPPQPGRKPFKEDPASLHPWPKPFVFPVSGSNKATVEFADLNRFDDADFLNDNLVAFGMRSIQENHPEQRDKIYIFNTFFYTSLTSGGSKSINYDAVKRWTAKIDLFKYNHVVVPINENAHWYLAIICNIGNLIPTASGEAVQEQRVQDLLDDQVDRLTLHSDPIQGVVVEGVWEQELRARKTDPSLPTIVTLDSLGGGHSPVIRVLKDYLVQEAKSKKGKDIPGSFLSRNGMSARGIPHQSNMSDCGVYMIGYVMKLYQNSSEFIAKLLAKEFDAEIDWLDFKDPSQMRVKMRQRIMDLYDEQNGVAYKSNTKTEQQLKSPTSLDAEAKDTTRSGHDLSNSIKSLSGSESTSRPSIPVAKLLAAKQKPTLSPALNTVHPAPQSMKSTAMKQIRPLPLASAHMEDLAFDDEEVRTQATLAFQGQPATTVTANKASSSHVIDRLLHDLDKPEPAPERSSRTESVALLEKLPKQDQQRRMENMRQRKTDTADELGQTPDAEHRTDRAPTARPIPPDRSNANPRRSSSGAGALNGKVIYLDADDDDDNEASQIRINKSPPQSPIARGSNSEDDEMLMDERPLAMLAEDSFDQRPNHEPVRNAKEDDWRRQLQEGADRRKEVKKRETAARLQKAEMRDTGNDELASTQRHAVSDQVGFQTMGPKSADESEDSEEEFEEEQKAREARAKSAPAASRDKKRSPRQVTPEL